MVLEQPVCRFAAYSFGTNSGVEPRTVDGLLNQVQVSLSDGKRDRPLC
jgi:hypothetical protein